MIVKWYAARLEHNNYGKNKCIFILVDISVVVRACVYGELDGEFSVPGFVSHSGESGVIEHAWRFDMGYNEITLHLNETVA